MGVLKEHREPAIDNFWKEASRSIPESEWRSPGTRVHLINEGSLCTSMQVRLFLHFLSLRLLWPGREKANAFAPRGTCLGVSGDRGPIPKGIPSTREFLERFCFEPSETSLPSGCGSFD